MFFHSVNENFRISIKHGFFKENFSNALNVQEGWQPEAVNNLYFLPGCAVPRFKVRNKYNCTIKPEKATAAFLSAIEIKPGSAVEVIKGTVELSPGDARSIMVDNFNWSNDANIREMAIYKNFEEQVDGFIMCSSIWESYFHTALDNMTYSVNDSLEQSRYGYKSEAQDFYAVIPTSGINKITCPIYFETDILKYLNEDQIVIDSEKYEELRSFGRAEDKENLVLLTELMANSDFDKSFVYLLLLLKEFGSQIAAIKAVDHINFKSLLSYLGINKKEIITLELKGLTDTLRKHKKFTRDNVQRVSTLCAGASDYQFKQNPMYTKGPVLKAEFENLLDS